MAPKDFQQFFGSDFQGIDGQRSALEPEGYLVNKATNLEMSVGNSLRGRVGCQFSGENFWAIFPYRYTRTQDQYDIVYQTAAGTYPTQTASLGTTKTTADGASIERLIALNKQVWTLDAMSVTVTYVSGTYPFTWYSYVNGSNINFCIKANGVSILDTSLGSGLGNDTTIYSLLNTIDGLAQLSVNRNSRSVCPPFAIVDGNQSSSPLAGTSYGSSWRITVDSGHNFSAGDIIWFPENIGGFVLSTTATTIDYVGGSTTLNDNEILGYMGQKAASFEIDVAESASSGNLTISFPYWRLIPEGDSVFGSIFTSALEQWLDKDVPTRTNRSFYTPAVAENCSGNLYIAASSVPDAGTDGWANNLIRIDGLQATRAGLPQPSVSVASNGAGALTGAYKYKLLLRRYDAQGNIWDGPLSELTEFTAAANSVALTLNGILYSNSTGFHVRSCFKHTTETPASGDAFYVDDSTGGVGNQAFIQPGDIICLTDNTAQTTGLFTDSGLATVVGTLHNTRCTAYSAQATTISPTISSIRVADSSGYQINTNTHITAGLTGVILRTTDSGNQYYVLGEVPLAGFGTLTLYDNATDAVLSAKEQYTEPEIGKEHDAPPPCTLVCAHQAGLAVARSPSNPNTVAFSTVEGVEYFPTASNSFDVPSTQSGSITAIASDSDDRLAVFKERAFYDVVGDLDGGTFSINIRNEGDYGITSQASLVRLPFGLLGLSKNGWVTISDGLLDPFRYEEVNARVINQAYQFAWATAVNDSFNRQYICTIPQVSGEPVGFTFDYSRRKNAPDVVYTKTMERSYPTTIDQAGGGAMVGDTLYHLSATSPYGVFRRLYRFNGDSPSGNGNGDSFIDNTNAINYPLELAPINRGDPEKLKQAIRARVWSIPNDYVVEGWVPFSLLVEAGYTPFSSTIANTNTGTSTTLTFTTQATDFFKDAKFKGVKSPFFMLRFTCNTIRTAPFLTGVSVVYAEDYEKEDLIK